MTPAETLHLTALRASKLHADLNRLRGKRRDWECALVFNSTWRGAWWATGDAQFDLSLPGYFIDKRGFREVLSQLHILEHAQTLTPGKHGEDV